MTRGKFTLPSRHRLEPPLGLLLPPQTRRLLYKMADSLVFALHQYGEHELQRLATWEPREPTTDPKAPWIV